MAEKCNHHPTGLYDPQYEHDSCGVGFIVRLDGEKSHKIIRDGIVALENLKHRGACGCEVNTGDGAGVLIQVPDHFLREVCEEQHIFLPPEGHYGTGLFFAAHDKTARDYVMQMFTAIVWDEAAMSSAGETSRRTTTTSGRQPSRRSRSSTRSSSATT